jgi:hypothetical protein
MDVSQIAERIVSRLDELAADIQKQWHNPEGTHTRHFVVDALLSDEMAQAIYEAFPRNADGFFDRQSFREKKKNPHQSL